MNRTGGIRGSGSSSKIRMLGTERKVPHLRGRPAVEKRTLSRQGIDEYRRNGEHALRSRLQKRVDMDVDHLEGLERLQSLAEDDGFRAGDVPDVRDTVSMAGILDGSERIELSHAGGEFESLEQGLEEDGWEDENNGQAKARRAEDWRTRRDRTDIRNRAFLSQMRDMVSAYIAMCAEAEMPVARASGDERHARVEEVYELRVVDMFDTSDVEVKLDPRGNGVAAALILAGLMPCAPWAPTVAFKIRVLEVYRVTHVRVAVSLINEQVAYQPSLCQQFSIAYDLYLDIRRRTDERVMHALGRDSTWRLKHACPACTYKLEGEDALIFDMLTTMDGNDSLKRVLRREKTTMAQDETGEPTLAKSTGGEVGSEPSCG
ncbi:hypothetical protein B0H12DRAFT_1079757 [Mycena haematopus]|nr:hypothetical protein B0H12DRAFT_1079757 [Mycena haematopus]